VCAINTSLSPFHTGDVNNIKPLQIVLPESTDQFLWLLADVKIAYQPELLMNHSCHFN